METVYVGCVELIVSMFPGFRTVLFRMVPKHISQAKYITKVTPNTSLC